MRSELVTQAAEAVKNRFLLVQVASAITRKFHRRTKDRRRADSHPFFRRWFVFIRLHVTALRFAGEAVIRVQVQLPHGEQISAEHIFAFAQGAQGIVDGLRQGLLNVPDEVVETA